MTPDDHQLSMRISRRPARAAPELPGLRTLLVHRLSSTVKAVLRRGLRHGNLGLHCQPCNEWFPMHEAPESVCCPTCKRLYRVELVIYEEVQ